MTVPAGAGAETSWQRLHPLSPIVRAARPLGALAVLALISLSSSRRSGNYTALLVDIGLVLLVLAAGVVAWLVTRWRIEGGVLRIESGLLRRTSRRFPPEQLQAVDVVRPGVARVFGLAEVRVRMAASTRESGRLSYLTDQEAQAVRARLLALAHGVAEHTAPPPEQILLRIPTGRLIGSILLSGLGLNSRSRDRNPGAPRHPRPDRPRAGGQRHGHRADRAGHHRVPPAQQRVPDDGRRGPRRSPAEVRSAANGGRDHPAGGYKRCG